MLYEIEVRNTLTSWSARGKRLVPGLYLTEDESLAMEARLVPQHITVRELPLGDGGHLAERIVEIDHYIPHDGGTGALVRDDAALYPEDRDDRLDADRVHVPDGTLEPLPSDMNPEKVDNRPQTVEEAAERGMITGTAPVVADPIDHIYDYSIYSAGDQKPTATEDKEPGDPRLNPLLSKDATIRAGADKDDFAQAEQLLGADARPRVDPVPAPAHDLRSQLRGAADRENLNAEAEERRARAEAGQPRAEKFLQPGETPASMEHDKLISEAKNDEAKKPEMGKPKSEPAKVDPKTDSNRR